MGSYRDSIGVIAATSTVSLLPYFRYFETAHLLEQAMNSSCHVGSCRGLSNSARRVRTDTLTD